jgi:hypothetical protein
MVYSVHVAIPALFKACEIKILPPFSSSSERLFSRQPIRVLQREQRPVLY